MCIDVCEVVVAIVLFEWGWKCNQSLDKSTRGACDNWLIELLLLFIVFCKFFAINNLCFILCSGAVSLKYSLVVGYVWEKIKKFVYLIRWFIKGLFPKQQKIPKPYHTNITYFIAFVFTWAPSMYGDTNKLKSHLLPVTFCC